MIYVPLSNRNSFEIVVLFRKLARHLRRGACGYNPFDLDTLARTRVLMGLHVRFWVTTLIRIPTHKATLASRVGYSKNEAIAYILLFRALNYAVVLFWGLGVQPCAHQVLS